MKEGKTIIQIGLFGETQPLKLLANTSPDLSLEGRGLGNENRHLRSNTVLAAQGFWAGNSNFSRFTLKKGGSIGQFFGVVWLPGGGPWVLPEFSGVFGPLVPRGILPPIIGTKLAPFSEKGGVHTCSCHGTQLLPYIRGVTVLPGSKFSK